MLWHRMAKLFTSKTDMAIAKPEVEWFYDPNTYWKEYGLLNLAGKWAVVKSSFFEDSADEYKVITEWLDDRKTALGFIKLLKEQ